MREVQGVLLDHEHRLVTAPYCFQTTKHVLRRHWRLLDRNDSRFLNKLSAKIISTYLEAKTIFIILVGSSEVNNQTPLLIFCKHQDMNLSKVSKWKLWLSFSEPIFNRQILEKKFLFLAEAAENFSLPVNSLLKTISSLQLFSFWHEAKILISLVYTGLWIMIRDKKISTKNIFKVIRGLWIIIFSGGIFTTCSNEHLMFFPSLKTPLR